MKRRMLLSALGVREDYLLYVPFQNSITDASGNYTMIPGNVTNEPTFVAGRKGTDYCAYFDGTKSIKTSSNFTLGTNKVSVSLWIKFAAFSSGTIIVELGTEAPSASNNLFDIVLRLSNRFTFRPKGGESIGIIELNKWYHFVSVADLSLGSGQAKTYIDGHLYNANGNTLIGNFANAILHIGQRGGTTQGFNGYIQDLQIYNRALSAVEIIRIFNKQK